MDYQRNLLNDEVFNMKRGIMNLELALKEAELDLEYYKTNMTGMAKDERFPGINPKLVELNIKKRELAVETAKVELHDLQVKLEMKLSKKPE